MNGRMPTVVVTLECCDHALSKALVKRMHTMHPGWTYVRDHSAQHPETLAAVIQDLLECHKSFRDDDFQVIIAMNWVRCAARSETHYDAVCRATDSLLSSEYFDWTAKHVALYLELPFHETFEHTICDSNRQDVDFVADLEMEGWMRRWMKSPARRILPCATIKHTVPVPSCASDNMADIMLLTDTIMDLLKGHNVVI